MEDITILQTVPTMIWTSGFNILFLITLLLSIICLFFCIWFFFDNDNTWVIALVMALFCGFFSFICWNMDEPIPGPNKYQVLIDKNVSIT